MGADQGRRRAFTADARWATPRWTAIRRLPTTAKRLGERGLAYLHCVEGQTRGPNAAAAFTASRTSIPVAFQATRTGIWRPLEMAWQGKSIGEICAQIKDRKRGDEIKSMEGT